MRNRDTDNARVDYNRASQRSNGVCGGRVFPHPERPHVVGLRASRLSERGPGGYIFGIEGAGAGTECDAPSAIVRFLYGRWKCDDQIMAGQAVWAWQHVSVSL